ncbi:MAG: DUF5011 domain-containing protein [Clostridiales bacterium]|nr:DUF5011 domain-containing protein [Clostridiales bacterium]
MREKLRLAKVKPILLLAGVCVVGCLVLLGSYLLKDKEAPVLSYSEARLTLSAEDVAEIEALDYSCLLEDVTAYDTRDGALDDRVIVQSCRFSEDSVYAVVTYQVADHSTNAATAKRIVYTAAEVYDPNYDIPVITLTTDTITVPLGTVPDLESYLDELSDVSDSYRQLLANITLSGEYDLYTPGEYELGLTVTDQDGNVSDTFSFTLVVTEPEETDEYDYEESYEYSDYEEYDSEEYNSEESEESYEYSEYEDYDTEE